MDNKPLAAQITKVIFGILLLSLLVFMSWLGFATGKIVFNHPKPTISLIANQPAKTDERPVGSIPFSETLHNLLPQENIYCSPYVQVDDIEDLEYCRKSPKLSSSHGVEINLTDQKALLIHDGKISKILPIAYQSPENIWFQTPTGFFKTGVKHKQHRSSLSGVQMPNAIQLYEDFFMHEIPFYDDGTRVTSQYSGGCLRFETNVAEELFSFIGENDPIVIYKTFENLAQEDKVIPPVNISQYWIRQRFNNPLRQFWNYSGNLEMLADDYYQHTGVDFSPNKDAEDFSAKSIADGRVVKIQELSSQDHGMGITVIIEHIIEDEIIYSLYAHLSSLSSGLKEGTEIKQGDTIGTIGNSGYGCQNYWKIGADGCENSSSENDTHLHFEIKKSGVIENPQGSDICQNKDYSRRHCYGYTPDNPEKYGYINPISFLFDKKSQ